MNANSSRSPWAPLFALLLSISSFGWLVAAAADNEPTPAVPAAGSDNSDDNNSDGGTTADRAETDVTGADSAEPAADSESSTADSKPAAPSTDTQPAGEPAKLPTVARQGPQAAGIDPATDTTAANTPATATPAAQRGPSLQPAESRLTVEAASFKGIQPGKSTAAELSKGWGAPKEIRKHKEQRLQIYEIEVFPKVTVTLGAGVVTSIVVNLEQSLSSEELAQQLSIDDISSVQVTDDKGQLLGEAFPERGVMFGYVPKSETPRVSQVVLEPIDAAPFLLRAESQLRTHYARCLADANAALEIDPKSAQAHGLRARVYFRAGDLTEALAAAQAAADLEPQETEWSLLVARIQIESEDFRRAQEQIENILDAKETPTLTKAKAHALLGDCLALAGEGSEQAMKHHQQAIKLAEPLATSSRVVIRRGAKEVLLDAHLGVAGDVGWGHWQQKGLAISKWIERAETFAQDLIKNEQADEDLLQRVGLAALAALSGVAEPPDATKWIVEYVTRADRLIDHASDTARRSQLEWEFGVALSHAATIEQSRGHYAKSLDYGRLSLKHLEAGESAGRQLPEHDFVLGQLLYKLGATAALGEQNHRRAIEWYGRAVTLLETPVPPSRLTDPGRHGETFVSMAVSYWELGQREEALRLTKQGIKLMEQAIDDGKLARSVLAVPYGNLASMHSELGNKQLAAEFAELSAKCERTKR